MCRKDTELYHLETFHEFPQSKSHSTKESKFPESVLTVFAKPKRQALVIRLRPISSAQKGKENKRDVSLSAATKRDVNLKAEIRHLVDLAFFSEAVYSDDAEPSQNQLPTPKAKKCVKKHRLLHLEASSPNFLTRARRTLAEHWCPITGNTQDTQENCRLVNVAEPTKHDRSASSQHPGTDTKRPEMTKQVKQVEKQVKQQELCKVGKGLIKKGHKTLPDTCCLCTSAKSLLSATSMPRPLEICWNRCHVSTSKMRCFFRSWGTKRIRSQDWLPTSFCTWRHRFRTLRITMDYIWLPSPRSCLFLRVLVSCFRLDLTNPNHDNV